MVNSLYRVTFLTIFPQVSWQLTTSMSGRVVTIARGPLGPLSDADGCLLNQAGKRQTIFVRCHTIEQFHAISCADLGMNNYHIPTKTNRDRLTHKWTYVA